MAFYRIKKNKLWVIKALDKNTGRTIAWELGNRDTKTFQRLYNKVKHLTKAVFYTDNWDVFAKVLPSDRHIIGKKYTTEIERDNSNTRHHLARFTRRTKVVSHNVDMVNNSLKLWLDLTSEYFFYIFQNIALTIFK